MTEEEKQKWLEQPINVIKYWLEEYEKASQDKTRRNTQYYKDMAGQFRSILAEKQLNQTA